MDEMNKNLGQQGYSPASMCTAIPLLLLLSFKTYMQNLHRKFHGHNKCICKQKEEQRGTDMQQLSEPVDEEPEIVREFIIRTPSEITNKKFNIAKVPPHVDIKKWAHPGIHYCPYFHTDYELISEDALHREKSCTANRITDSKSKPTEVLKLICIQNMFSNNCCRSARRRQMEKFFERKKERANVKAERTWYIEDADSEHILMGTRPGEQSHFVLFMMEVTILYLFYPLHMEVSILYLL
jgi:hypothetical protein